MFVKAAVLVIVLMFSVVMAFSIDTTDQDTQNLVAMLKRNGFTEEAELQKALEVLRPDKFKSNNNVGGSRTRRQAPVVPPQVGPKAVEEPLAALVAPPLDATNNALAHSPIAPQLPTDQHQLDGGVIAPHEVRPVLNKVIGVSSADSAPSSSSSSISVSSTTEEDTKENENRGILSGVVHRVASLFSASE